MKKVFLGMLLFLISSVGLRAQTTTFPAQETNNTFSGTNNFNGVVNLNLATYIVSTLPSPASVTIGYIVIVTDSTPTGLCTVGSGSILALCRNTGSAWAPVSSSGSVSGQSQYSIPVGATATTLTSLVCTPPAINGIYQVLYNPTASVAVAPICPQLGLIPDQAAGANVLYSDNGGVILNPAAALAIPTLATLGTPNFYTVIDNEQSASIVVTPTVPYNIKLNRNAAGTSQAPVTIQADQKCSMVLDSITGNQLDLNCSPTAYLPTNEVLVGVGNDATETALADTSAGALAETYNATTHAFGTIVISSTGTSSFTTGAASTTTATIPALTQNTTRVVSFYLTNPIVTMSNLYYTLTTADNSANVYDLGVYGPNCLNGATLVPLIWHIGPTVGTTFGPATGVRHLAVVGAPVTTNLGPGWYCWAVTSSGATPAAVFGGDLSPHVQMFSPGVAISGTTSSGTLNSTITAPTLNVQSGGTAFFAGY